MAFKTIINPTNLNHKCTCWKEQFTKKIKGQFLTTMLELSLMYLIFNLIIDPSPPPSLTFSHPHTQTHCDCPYIYCTVGSIDRDWHFNLIFWSFLVHSHDKGMAKEMDSLSFLLFLCPSDWLKANRIFFSAILPFSRIKSTYISASYYAFQVNGLDFSTAR